MNDWKHRLPTDWLQALPQERQEPLVPECFVVKPLTRLHG